MPSIKRLCAAIEANTAVVREQNRLIHELIESRRQVPETLSSSYGHKAHVAEHVRAGTFGKPYVDRKGRIHVLKPPEPHCRDDLECYDDESTP